MRILLVEDEHRIANTLKKGLEQERYAVDVAYDGGEGMDLALSEEYDLLILDYLLPEVDGLTICRTLREKQIHTPVLMLTAKGQEGDKVSGLDAGADDYVTKPFSFVELLARVRALTRRPRGYLDTLLVVDDLHLDTKNYSVERAGKMVQLSGKEFALLEYFMRHPHQVISKDQLIHHVWDYQSDILPNTVEVYIRNLRKKLDQPFADLPALLHTVRGFGYKLGK